MVRAVVAVGGLRAGRGRRAAASPRVRDSLDQARWAVDAIAEGLWVARAAEVGAGEGLWMKNRGA